MIGKMARSLTDLYGVLQKIMPVLKMLLVKYPALSAAGLNVAVALAARFGLHVSPTVLVSIVSGLAALSGAWVHSRVSPVTKKGKPVS